MFFSNSYRSLSASRSPIPVAITPFDRTPQSLPLHDSSRTELLDRISNGHKIEFSDVLQALGLTYLGDNNPDWTRFRLQQIDPPVALATPSTQRYRILFDEVPVCDAIIETHLINNEYPLLLGKIPSGSILPPVGYTWDLSDISPPQEPISSAPQIDTSSLHRCWHEGDDTLHPAVEGIGHEADQPFRWRWTRQGFVKKEPLSIPVTAYAKIYRINALDGETLSVPIEVIGDGTLTDSYFKTETGSVTRAQITGTSFDFPIDDPRFAETQVFTHAQKYLEWFFTLGYTWLGQVPLILELHATFGGNGEKNNALYLPYGTEKNQPKIRIGDGDGRSLTNLALDREVVSHELGHHIAFRKLTSVEGQALVLHEGIADFFVYAYTGNSCLAESICPAQSHACWVQGKCLRSGDNTLRLDAPIYPSLLPHLQSQVISGMLWQLYSQDGGAKVETPKLVYRAIDYLLPQSTFRDFIIALLAADLELFEKRYSCSILDLAGKRSFGDAIANLDCKTFEIPETIKPQTAKTPSTNQQPAKSDGSTIVIDQASGQSKGDTATNNPSNTRKKSSGQCGQIRGHLGQGKKGADDAMILIVIVIPILLSLAQYWKRSLAKGTQEAYSKLGDCHAPISRSHRPRDNRFYGPHH